MIRLDYFVHTLKTPFLRLQNVRPQAYVITFGYLMEASFNLSIDKSDAIEDTGSDADLPYSHQQ